MMSEAGVMPQNFKILEIASIPRIRAAIFDFNGTMTDDETLQYEVYAQTFADEAGLHLERDTYFSRLAGLCDSDLIREVFIQAGTAIPGESTVARIGQQRISRYLERVRCASPVRAGAAELVRELRQHIPLAVVTGAPRDEAVPVLRTARLLDAFTTVVTGDDVEHGKPSPEGFLLALDRMRGLLWDLLPTEVVVFEDSLPGVLAARCAGMRCVAVHLKRETDGHAADVTAGQLDARLLGPGREPAAAPRR
jgi:HAD superfamily hydrolase (TIGR01509 family)